MKIDDIVAAELARELPPKLPPYERVRDHAADQLIELLTCDCTAALISACHDDEVREAIDRLLRVLVTKTGNVRLTSVEPELNGR